MGTPKTVDMNTWYFLPCRQVLPDLLQGFSFTGGSIVSVVDYSEGFELLDYRECLERGITLESNSTDLFNEGYYALRGNWIVPMEFDGFHHRIKNDLPPVLMRWHRHSDRVPTPLRSLLCCSLEEKAFSEICMNGDLVAHFSWADAMIYPVGKGAVSVQEFFQTVPVETISPRPWMENLFGLKAVSLTA